MMLKCVQSKRYSCRIADVLWNQLGLENNNVDVGLDESGQDEFPIWVAQNATTNEVSTTVTVLGQVASCDLEVAGNFSVIVFLHLRQKCPCLQTGI